MTKNSMRSKTIQKVVAVIRKNKRFIMVAHECPDGDSLGSAMAMVCALKKLKKDVCIMTDMVPEKYKYLPFSDTILSKPPADIGERVAMLFDTPTLERLGSLERSLADCKILINVDHHISNKRYGSINWVDPKAACVGEQVYELIGRLRVKMDRNIATCLYTSVVTDTGKFQYSNTSVWTHRMTAELLATGIDHQRIVENIYEDYPKEKLNLLSRALSSVQLEWNGKVAWILVTQDMLKSAATTLEWADDIINFIRGIRGVQVACVIKESDEPGCFKISFRSKNPRLADVNTVARCFGGGGHRAASGCNIRGTQEEVVAKVLAELRKIHGLY